MDYNRKIAVGRARADAKKAVADWHNMETVGIDVILRKMGYSESRHGFYDYTRSFGDYIIHLDTYELVVGFSNKINWYIREKEIFNYGRV